MAEIFWIVELGPINLNAATKVSKMKRIWSIKPPISFPEDSPFLGEEILLLIWLIT
jgi:5-methylcytosine-specific restriction protein B